MESIKMSDELIAKIIEIGGWDTAKKLEEKMREEQDLKNQQQHQADEEERLLDKPFYEEGLLDEIKF